jgi:hypothetical protein
MRKMGEMVEKDVGGTKIKAYFKVLHPLLYRWMRLLFIFFNAELHSWP